MVRKRDRLAFLGAVAISFLAGGCGVTEKTESRSMLPTARVAMGISESALQSQSSVQFRIEDSGNIKALWIDEPYNLEYGEGNDRIILKDIGGESFSTGITVTNGEVDTITVIPQSRLLTLSETIVKARELSGLLKSAGFTPRPESTWFRAWDWNAKAIPTQPTAATLLDAQNVLADSDAMVSEASLYAGTKGTLSAVVGVRNGRRMRAMVGNETARDESGAASAREWTLELSIVPKVEN